MWSSLKAPDDDFAAVDAQGTIVIADLRSNLVCRQAGILRLFQRVFFRPEAYVYMKLGVGTFLDFIEQVHPRQQIQQLARRVRSIVDNAEIGHRS